MIKICKQCRFDEEHSVSGQGFTKYRCQKCGQEMYWHNTNVPKLCPDCSDKYNLCMRCGKTMEEQ